MINVLLALFVGILAPIPWVIVIIHMLVFNNKWNSHVLKFMVLFLAIIAWAFMSYWLLNNHQILFEKQSWGIMAQIAGVVVLIFALAIEVFTTKALGTKRIFGSSEFGKSKDVLVTTGIYAYARHPRYVEHPLWFLGLGLLLSYPAFIWFSIYLFAAFSIAAYVEERELMQRYGQQYMEYKKGVPAFFLRFF